MVDQVGVTAAAEEGGAKGSVLLLREAVAAVIQPLDPPSDPVVLQVRVFDALSTCIVAALTASWR